MSVSMYFQPANNRKYVKGADSQVTKALELAFGEFPMQLGADEHPLLQAMSFACPHEPNPYAQLMDAVSRYGCIVVDAEY